jgi:arabinose-5-phosphate isomerase
MRKSARKAHFLVLQSARAALNSIHPASLKQVADAAVFIAARKGKIITSGMGKSGFIAAKVAATLTSLGVPAVYMHPSEAMHGDIGILHSTDTILAFSHSGSTHELLAMLVHAPIPVVAVTGAVHSRLAVQAKRVIGYRIVDEGSPYGLAPMASTTISLVLGDMLAAYLATLRGFAPARFARLHPAGTLGLQLTAVHAVMHRPPRLPLVRHTSSLIDALQVVSAKKLGIAGVTDAHGRLIGSLTDGDVRRFLQAGNQVLSVRVEEVMSRHPKTITESDSLLGALHCMEQHKITALFVVDAGDRPRGLVHMHQIIEHHLV